MHTRLLARSAAIAMVCSVTLSITGCANTPMSTSSSGPITIERQGSFFVGGRQVQAAGTFDPTAATNPGTAGQSYWVDQMYVQYQIPVNARKLPLVLVHGGSGTGRVWETTPDGREGYQTIFLRRGFPVYIIDQPRRGRAARSTQSMNVAAAPDEQLWFGIFRLGVWPDFYPNVSFAREPEALNQFFRQT